MTVLYGSDVYLNKQQICHCSHHLIVTSFWGMGTITNVGPRCCLQSAKAWEFVREIGVYWEVSAGFMKPTFEIYGVKWVKVTKNMVLLIL
jgi:hypothetical protein